MLKASRPSFKQVSWHSNSCFNTKIDSGDTLSNAWHYHPEVELILVKHSRGTRIVGNSVETFQDNDLVLIGKNTPHAFLYDEKCLMQTARNPEAMVIQFYEDFLGNEFMKLSELNEINAVLMKSRQGLCVTEPAKSEVVPLVEKFFESSPFDRMILILQILKTITQRDAHRLLVQEDGYPRSARTTDQRMNTILEYTYAKYDEHISIEDVARMVNLTKESFCRYFKTHTHKTYIEFLTEHRIKKACQMIRQGGRSMKEIGYGCGFDSLSNFYYQFKKITGLSPLEFRRQTAAGHQDI